MKILVLSYEYPPVGGGGGVICRNLSENLAKLGNEVTVLTTENPVPGIWNPLFEESGTKTQNTGQRTPENGKIRTRHSEIQNLKVVRIKALRRNLFQSNPVEMLSWIHATKQFIRDHPGFLDFDICMAHFVLPGGEVALWLKRKFGLPYVLVSHGHEIPWVHPRQMFFFHLGAYFWIKKVCVHSEFNFIQTKMMKANIDRFMGLKYSEKNVIIPNGVDTEKFYPDNSKRPSRLRVIFVGRLVIQKDPLTFLEAIRLFSKKISDFEVRIAGDGNLRPRMERFVVSHGLEDHVTFLGIVPQDEMAGEYQAAHVMVASSLNEGMNIAALEALSCGVYLIATRASGFEEMIREGINGEFIRFRDPGNIAEKLAEFCRRNRKEQIISKNLLHEIGEPYGWDSISRDYLALLGESIKESP